MKPLSLAYTSPLRRTTHYPPAHTPAAAAPHRYFALLILTHAALFGARTNNSSRSPYHRHSSFLGSSPSRCSRHWAALCSHPRFPSSRAPRRSPLDAKATIDGAGTREVRYAEVGRRWCLYAVEMGGARCSYGFRRRWGSARLGGLNRTRGGEAHRAPRRPIRVAAVDV
ncbi:hypothetical protein HYPSUDRAFT_280157 [Hypholoma sublateritium FD-334 SS-4]|uniref:Uncharacterized protein n=1 Tax=Hypholoma sublateritium (strain FD-334 SS-4) TaxID=945553 RepID=A0A0D2PDJ1_HYPSF|nr:hypothetical protein HYPSUDRAFT_280157 [Hypholoma sublateritium FD-334 SS-4]